MQELLKRVLPMLLVLILAAGCANNPGNTAAPPSAADISGAQPAPSQPALPQPAPGESQERAKPEEPATQTELPPDLLPTSKPSVRVGALKGPTGMGLARLMDINEKGAALCYYDFALEGAPDVIQGPLLAGNLDIAILPTNLASVLYNKTGGEIQLIAVSGLRVLYIMAKPGVEISSFADLAGKTVFTAGQGSTQEYVLDYLLRQNGLDPQTDLTVEYKSEHAETMAQLLAGNCDAALLPQPFATNIVIQNPEVKQALDITAEWDKVSGGAELTMSCVVARTEFASENPEAIESFLKEYDESTKWVNENIDEAAVIIGQNGIVPEAVAKAAIPGSAIECRVGDEANASVSAYLAVLFEQNPASVGGKLPDEGFFYKR